MTVLDTSPPHQAVGASRKAAGVLLAAGAGVLVAVQSRVNGELATRLGDGVLTAWISFATGLALLAVLVPAVPGARGGVARLRAALRHGRLRFWQCLGGFGGALLVITQGVTVGVLGVAVFVVAVVAGQTGSSLLVDRAGLGPGGRRPSTRPRVAGAALALAGVAVAMSGRIQGELTWWLVLLPLAAGAGTAVQLAVNGRVRGASGSALTATLVNFVAGITLLSVTWLLVRLVQGPPRALPTEAWLYVGGPIGVVFIAVAAIVVRWIGVLLFALATVAGQLMGAVALDLVVPPPGAHLRAATVAGTAVTLVAVGIAALPPRRPR